MLSLLTDNAVVVPEKPKHTLLPILTVLFLVSYGLMAMLIVEQGRTIDTQRYLIRELFSDSAQLNALRGSTAQKQRADAKSHALAQAPSAQAGPKDRVKGQSAGKLRQPLPQKPPEATSDTADERRSLNTI